MKFKIHKDELFSGTLELESAILGGSARALLNGDPLARAKEKGAPFLLKVKDGTTQKLYVRPHFLDPVPSVFLEQKEILIAEKLRPVDCFLAILPLGMFIGHGPLPAVIGYFVIVSNFKILRTKWLPSLKWAAIYGLSISVFYLISLLTGFIWSIK